MPIIKINHQEYEVPTGLTMLQAARLVGIEIPVFCYHERLAIAGNCRMCLVELENSPKLVASCAMPIADGMSFNTLSDRVKKARKGVLEFLLINHPLDCPICDQGGECDLQDITMAYGPSQSRFSENKRAVRDKYMGPLIKTSMNRCIHCTRCIRFMTDVAGVPELGAINRGENMEILSYLNRAVSSELSGNVIDLCPVGALTSKPYAYKARPWELTKTESIDVMDAVGSAIRIDSHHMQVMRILPRLNEDINEEWLSDKSRFACDGLRRQRLDRPYIRNAQGQLEPTTWEEAFAAISSQLQHVPGHQIAAIAGDLVDVEAMVALKDLMNALGSVHLECRQDGAQLDPRYRAAYIFNSTIAGIEEADFCLIIGANLRRDAPLIAARLRKRYLRGGLVVAYIGGEIAVQQRLTIPVMALGHQPHILEEILKRHHPIAEPLRMATKPMVILGQDALQRSDGAVLLRKVRILAEEFGLVRHDWNGFNVLHKAAARVGGLDSGFYPKDHRRTIFDLLEDIQAGKIKVVYLLGADEIEMTPLKKAFVIYQGHHGDRGAQSADVILPGAAYTEKDATYVNTEGRPQHAYRALDPPGDAKVDWQIICELATVLGCALPYATLGELRHRMVRLNSVFAHINKIIASAWGDFGEEGELSPEEFAPSKPDFYMTDSISRHSLTMAHCFEEIGQAQAKGQAA
jgi:NADH-quinone oxidoreductase subunit G